MSVENLCDLLFELSSAERINIMLTLGGERLKLSQVSQRLDMTVTEASRHLQRLSDVQLIHRDPDGTFSPTPYGELAMSLLSGLEFISDHRQYLLEHDLGSLPHGFVNRIGELSGGALAADVMTGLRIAEVMYQEAEEYAWVLSDQVLVSATSIVRAKVVEGVRFRSIFPERFTPPPGYTPSPGVDRRTLPEVKMRIMVTEKMALVCFPYSNGSIDYAPFHGSDPRFHRWVKDLYEHHWVNAKPSSSTLLTPDT